jgi:uncharacterized protein
MKRVFADTAYYLALTNLHDQHSAAAATFTSQFSGAFVTTLWVLLEVANFLGRGPNRALFCELYKDLTSDDRVTIVPADQIVFERGIALYAKRLDKQWSLTDCISFVVIQDYQLVEAATTDHHFKQAGFKVLLKS